jgi:hypothetical protein
MIRLFQLLAVVLAGIAAYFLWSGQAEAAFVTVVLGAVSFFLGVRFDFKDRIRARDDERAESKTAEEVETEEAGD